MTAPADDVTVHQITCDRCPATVHVGTQPSALAWALGSLGWWTHADTTRHLCPDCAASTVRLTDLELTEAANLIENGDGDLISDEAILALIAEVRAARARVTELEGES